MPDSEGRGKKRFAITGELWRSLVQWASRHGRSVPDSEDLVQSAFVRLEEQLRKGMLVRGEEAFLKTAIRNLGIDKYRRLKNEKRVPEPVETLALRSEAPAPSDFVDEDELMRDLCAHLDEIVGKPAREVYVYNRVHGYTYDEIAKLMGVSPKTVEKRLARAVHSLSELKTKMRRA